MSILHHPLLRPIAALMLVALLLPACANNRTGEERKALYDQNVQLQRELDAARAALDASGGDSAEAARLRAQIAEMERRQAMQPATPPVTYQPPQEFSTPPMVDTGDGFEDIPEVDTSRTGTSSLEVTLASDILFASGSATLTPTARRTLDQVAQVLQSKYPDKEILVKGHTDSDPIRKSSWRDNQHLSEARAQAVVDYLQSRDVDASRLTMRGYGMTQPKRTKLMSRRVEIVVIGEGDTVEGIAATPSVEAIEEPATPEEPSRFK